MFDREASLVAGLMDRASAIALDVYRSDFSARDKGHDDPVTEADRRVNEYLVEAIGRAFPGDLVVGEESGFTGAIPDTGRAWFVDPVDGTKDFILKNGEWSIMVGLAVDQRAALGVVCEPAAGRLYVAAAGLGATRRAHGHTDTLRGPSAKPIRDATVINSRNHPDARVARVLVALGITREFDHGSVGCKLARIAEGQADAYFNFSGRCHMWDTCAPEVILREAGGALTALDGSALAYAGQTTRVTVPFFAAGGAVHRPILEALATLGPELQPG